MTSHHKNYILERKKNVASVELKHVLAALFEDL